MRKEDYEKAAKLTDIELVSEIVTKQNMDLFEVVYDRYAPLIYRKCISLVKDPEKSKDLTHDILMKVFLNISQFQGRSNFSLWVHSISYNHCMQYFKKEKRIQWDHEEPESYENLDLESIEAENTEILEAQIKTLEYCFSGLKEEYSIILSMRYYADMSVKNISHTLQIGESAVKMRLKRGRDMLALCMQPKK